MPHRFVYLLGVFFSDFREQVLRVSLQGRDCVVCSMYRALKLILKLKKCMIFVFRVQVLFVYLRSFLKTAQSKHCFVVQISSVNGQLRNIFGRKAFNALFLYWLKIKLRITLKLSNFIRSFLSLLIYLFAYFVCILHSFSSKLKSSMEAFPFSRILFLFKQYNRESIRGYFKNVAYQNRIRALT
jgi:hypothetical protein